MEFYLFDDFPLTLDASHSCTYSWRYLFGESSSSRCMAHVRATLPAIALGFMYAFAIQRQSKQ